MDWNKIIIFLCLLAGGNNLAAQNSLRTATVTVLQSLGIPNRDSLTERLQILNRQIRQQDLGRNGEEHAIILQHDKADVLGLYFTLLYLSYYGLSDYGLANTRAFLERQQSNGCIADDKGRVVMPFLAQIILLGAKQSNHYTWLKEKPDGTGHSYYERLKYYLDYWWQHRDVDGNGLPAWNSLPGSRMAPPYHPTKRGETALESVELACYLHRELKAMTGLAHQLHYEEDKAYYQQKARELARQINAYLWDEKEGFYYDRDETSGKPLRLKTVAGFLPLFAGVAPYERAERIVRDHLLKKGAFWQDILAPVNAEGENDHIWIPANYMVFQGLMDYGYREAAGDLATNAFHEVYQEEIQPSVAAGHPKKQAPWPTTNKGWAALAHLMPWEYELNYTPSTLSWQPLIPLVPDYLGIEMNPN